jgi:adenylosuccinate synthase
MIVDIPERIYKLRKGNQSVLFEGAQGMMLDVDHGTYPFVTSSNTTAGGACTGTGIGPQYIDYVLGITKAYTTRVGAGPFPTELFVPPGDILAARGNEFGSTTGRPRRCGWLDTVGLRRAVQINGISGLCVTKLDVLDELETIRICVEYVANDQQHAVPPGAEAFESFEPVYVDLPGWCQSTAGAARLGDLPTNARAYLDCVEDLVQTPIDLISTGAERNQAIVSRHPFG